MKYSSYKKWSDHYTKKAKLEKYPARSIYKIKEIQEKYNIVKKGNKVLDLGCYPGSWLIYISKIVGKKGFVLGIDLNPLKITLPKNTKTITENIFNFETIFNRQPNLKFNSVISDMSPATTGNNCVDTERSLKLCNISLKITNKLLLPGGTFVCKIFHGTSLKKFSETVKKNFQTQLLVKPKSVRKTSKEIYVVGINKLKIIGDDNVRT